MSDKKLALIVANFEFKDEKLQKLTSPAKDAEALASILGVFRKIIRNIVMKEA